MYILNDNQVDPFRDHSNSSILAPVVKRPLKGVGRNDADLPVVGLEGTYASRDGKPVFLGVVSENFKLVQMRDLTRAAETAIKNYFTPEQIQTTKIKDVSGRDGAYVERRYTIKAISEAVAYSDIDVGTTIAAELRIRTGYDGQTSTGCASGTVDLVCDNGMVSWKSLDAISRRHTKFAGDISVFTPWLDSAMPGFQSKVNTMREWAAATATWKQIEAAVEGLPQISERRAAAILSRCATEVRNRGYNAYGVSSAFTFYSSHNSSEFPVKKTGNDNVAVTLAARETEVSSWLASPAFASLTQIAA